MHHAIQWLTFSSLLVQFTFGIDEPVDCKAQSEFSSFTCVTTNQCAARLVQNGHGARHEIAQEGFSFCVQSRRNSGNCGGGMGRCAHRKNVTQRVVGRDATKEVRVVDKGSKEIDRVNQRFPGRYPDDSCIIGRMETHQDIGVIDGCEVC